MPPVLTGVITWLAMICPAWEALRLEAVGRYVCAGQIEKKPSLTVSVTVALTTTAPMPLAGRLARPATGTWAVRLWPGSAPSGGSRLSRSRCGVTGTNRPTSLGGVLAPVKNPTRSITTCPPVWANTVVLPPASRASTWLAIVVPVPVTLRLLTIGRPLPVGNTVQNPVAVLSVTVTFKAAAVASAGTVTPAIAARPTTSRLICSPATSGPKCGEVGSRVSIRRVGLTGTNSPEVAITAGV